jgi:hypothetical protein
MSNTWSSLAPGVSLQSLDGEQDGLFFCTGVSLQSPDGEQDGLFFFTPTADPGKG